jgi:TolA-binding protein
LRGKQLETNIWEVFSSDPDELRFAKLAIAKQYNDAIKLFQRKDYAEALNLFKRCLTKLPNDKVIQMYIKQLQQSK